MHVRAPNGAMHAFAAHADVSHCGFSVQDAPPSPAIASALATENVAVHNELEARVLERTAQLEAANVELEA